MDEGRLVEIELRAAERGWILLLSSDARDLIAEVRRLRKLVEPSKEMDDDEFMALMRKDMGG